MLPILDPDDAQRVPDEALRQLLVQRFAEVSDGEPYDPEVMAAFWLVEPGDSLAEIEAASGPILSGLFGGPRYGEPGFVPSFEALEAHPGFYELVLVGGEGDDGVVLLIPQAAGIDPELLDFCSEYASPAPSRVVA
jgi:hypothetical protein